MSKDKMQWVEVQNGVEMHLMKPLRLIEMEKLGHKTRKECLKNDKCSHDFKMIDALREGCSKCGKILETNPYTGEVSIFKEENKNE